MTATITPQDHLAKKGVPREFDVNGVKLEISPDVFDDFELLDAIDQTMNEGNSLRVAFVVRRMCGDRYEEVMDALRDPATGRVPAESVGDLIKEIMTALAPNSAR